MGSAVIISLSFSSFFYILCAIYLFTYYFSDRFISYFHHFHKLFIGIFHFFSLYHLLFVGFFSSGILRAFSVFTAVHTGHFSISLRYITQKVPPVYVIYITVFVVIYTIVRYFFGVSPNDILQIFVIDIDTRIYNPNGHLGRFKPF